MTNNVRVSHSYFALRSSDNATIMLLLLSWNSEYIPPLKLNHKHRSNQPNESKQIKIRIASNCINM